MKRDIEDRKDIELMINTFYEKVIADPFIGPFFTETVKINWDRHLPIMYDFWDNAIFFSGTYTGRPLEAHKHLNSLAPLRKEHFEQWNKLFSETVNGLFTGEKATLAISRAYNISAVMQSDILNKI